MNIRAVDRGVALRDAMIGMLLPALLACGVPEPDGSAAAVPDAAITDSTASATSQPRERATDPDSKRTIDADRLIRSDGIGHFAAGMTIGDLRSALPPGTSLGVMVPYMVDIDAMPVVHDGDTLYVVLIPAGEPTDNGASIDLVATTDTTFRTAEGVGPGSSLAEAAAVYGPPTLAYNINDESREHATFPALPPTIRMRVQPAAGSAAFAGVYTTDGEYNETSRYDPGARVMMVIVVAR